MTKPVHTTNCFNTFIQAGGSISTFTNDTFDVLNVGTYGGPGTAQRAGADAIQQVGLRGFQRDEAAEDVQ